MTNSLIHVSICVILEQSSKRTPHSNAHLTTMRCPFLALYTIGSCPVLKSTALSLPAWISILMLGISTNTHSILVRSTVYQINLFNSFLNTDSPALDHFDCILFVRSDTEFGQKLEQMVALHHKVPLKQAQNSIYNQTDGTEYKKPFCLWF